MALIKCPECGKEVSDKAEACPNCGYPACEFPNGTKSKMEDQEELIASKKKSVSFHLPESLNFKKAKNYKKYIQISILLIFLGLLLVGVIFFPLTLNRSNENSKGKEVIANPEENIEKAEVNIKNETDKLSKYSQRTFSAVEGCRAIMDVANIRQDMLTSGKYANDQISTFYSSYVSTLEYVINNTTFDFECNPNDLVEAIKKSDMTLPNAELEYREYGISSVVEYLYFMIERPDENYGNKVFPYIIYNSYKEEWDDGIKSVIEKYKRDTDKSNAETSYNYLLNELTYLNLVDEYKSQMDELALANSQKSVDQGNTTEDMPKAEPSMGMSENGVKESSWGCPEEINKTTTANGIREQWVYGNDRYIYLEDGVVTAIQE